MTYDAALVAERGLGVAELRLASPVFLQAVRWAAFVGRAAPSLAPLQALVATDPPAGLAGQALTTFIRERSQAREQLRDLVAVLYPPDEDGDG
jgi:hypothetical protein